MNNHNKGEAFMIYSDWMSYIKDDVKITQLVIPGSHNAGSYGMRPMACCQNDNLLTQIIYGVRQFCLRLNTDKNGNIVLAHGITKGDKFENALKDIRTAMDNYPSEIFLLDIREYYPQKFGPITLTYKADKNKVNALLKEYIDPEKYAYCDFEHIKDVTIGDIRKAGKRYILINDTEEYDYSRNCEQILPWDKKLNGSYAATYAKEAPHFFDTNTTEGLYWFQTQQTPNPGTEVGLTNPKKLDKELRLYFKDMINAIADNWYYLSCANIIAGDFMTEDYMKSEAILKLNLLKNNVKDELKEAYAEGLLWS